MWRSRVVAGSVFLGLLGLPFDNAGADEGGVSAWIPGFFGSLAATPMVPGPQLATMYYHATVDASGDAEFVSGGGISVGLDGNANILLAIPGYVFEEPVLGGQVFISVAVPAGHMEAS